MSMYTPSTHSDSEMDNPTAFTGLKSEDFTSTDNLGEIGYQDHGMSVKSEDIDIEEHDLSRYLVHGKDMVKEGRITYSGGQSKIQGPIPHSSNIIDLDKIKPESSSGIARPRIIVTEDIIIKRETNFTNTNNYTNLNVTNANNVTNSNMNTPSTVTRSHNFKNINRPQSLVTNKNKCPQTYVNPRTKRCNINSQMNDPNSFESMFITSDNVTNSTGSQINVTNSQPDVTSTSTSCDVTLQIKDDYILKLLLSKPKPMSFKPAEKETENNVTTTNNDTEKVTVTNKDKKEQQKDTGNSTANTVILEENSQVKDPYELCKSVTMQEKEMLDLREVLRNQNAFKESQFKCDKCIESFTNNKSLETHNMKHHIVSGIFECSVCEQRFYEDHDRDNHCKQHYVLLECFECKFWSNSKEKMVEHVNSNHTKERVFCKFCPQTFLLYVEYLRHLETSHKGFRCDDKECGAYFLKKAHLVKHIKSKHMTDTFKYPRLLRKKETKVTEQNI